MPVLTPRNMSHHSTQQDRRSYLVPTHLIPTHFVSTSLVLLLLNYWFDPNKFGVILRYLFSLMKVCKEVVRIYNRL